MGRKVKPPFIRRTTGNPYLDFFAAAVALAIQDVERPSDARPHDACSALAFLTENHVAAGLVHRADYPLPSLRELNQAMGDRQEAGSDAVGSRHNSECLRIAQKTRNPRQAARALRSEEGE